MGEGWIAVLYGGWVCVVVVVVVFSVLVMGFYASSVIAIGDGLVLLLLEVMPKSSCLFQKWSAYSRCLRLGIGLVVRLAS